jgi:hypothetical protein
VPNNSFCAVGVAYGSRIAGNSCFLASLCGHNGHSLSFLLPHSETSLVQPQHAEPRAKGKLIIG